MSQEMVIQSSVYPVIPYADMERMAAVIAQSGLFGVKHPVQALALMLVAQAEGQHPATAARDYHVIQGRPALKTDAMLARFQSAGGRVQWHDYSDDVVSATFTHAAGGAVKIEWTIERAKTAGLTGKDVWKQYPRAMLRARVISEGIRTVYPGVLSGMYAPEEVRDMVHDVEPALAPMVAEVLPPAFDPDAADRWIAACSDVTKLRLWLAEKRRLYGWNVGDLTYEMLKSACVERAEVIKRQATVIEAPAKESADE
jgi:hypothetical protein